MSIEKIYDYLKLRLKRNLIVISAAVEMTRRQNKIYEAEFNIKLPED